MSKGRAVPPPLPRELFAPATRMNPTPDEILAALSTGLYMLQYLHDDWCAFFDGGACDCNPTVQLMKYRGSDDEQ